MKKYLIIIIIVLLGAIGVGWLQFKTVTEKLEVSEANVKAYSNELSNSKDKNVALQLTVDLLGYFNDSILLSLDDTRRLLKIKDKNLKALLAVKSSFTKSDTIIVTDTLFKEPTLAIDTIIGDEWYNLLLGLKYPSTIAIKPNFKSEKHIVVSTKRETINPPKKFFLLRWFLKKHTILQVDVIEKNPYVQGESSKFIEILR